MTARSQAQNAADAGALAGATSLFRDGFTDHAKATDSAITAAQLNQVMGKSPSVIPGDVEFLVGPNGQQNRVKVTVHRTSARGNPVSTMIAKFFGVASSDVAATATAEATPANAMTCVKPFTIPDKWLEKGTPPWDGNDTYDAFNNKGVPLENPDIYIPATQPGYTGYNQESNRGQLLELRAGSADKITVSFYFSLSIGGMAGTGGDDYRWNIANCNTTIMHFGDPLIQEPGAMSGPTIQGAEELIARDPGAYWDPSTKSVKGSNFGNNSPRVFPIPLYDPIVYDSGKRNGRSADLVTANWIGFYLDYTSGNSIWGRIIPISGIYDKNSGPAPAGSFPVAIRLVQ